MREDFPTQCTSKHSEAHDVVGSFSSVFYLKQLRKIDAQHQHYAGVTKSHESLNSRLDFWSIDEDQGYQKSHQ